MLLTPRRQTKFKQHTRRDTNKSVRKLTPNITGYLSFYVEEPGKLSFRQFRTIKQLLKKEAQRKMKIWNKLFFFRAITKKSAEVRLGRGKGNIKYYSYILNPGTKILECSKIETVKNIKPVLKILQNKSSNKLTWRDKRQRWIL